MKRTFILSLCLLALMTASAQTQQGYVKTKGRLGSNGSVIAGTRLAGATVSVRGGNAVVSGSNGTFSLVIPASNYYLQNVQKLGYVLTDPDILSKQYAYSKNPLVLVLEDKAQQEADQKAIARKISSNLYAQLQKRSDELEALKEQQRITEEKYRELLQELNRDQDNNEKLISQMADRYAKLDFDELDDFNRRISQLIIDGKLTEADSLLNTKGDINSRAEVLRQHQEANTQTELELQKKQKKLERSKDLARKELEDLAQDCYSKYEIFKAQFQNDSAAYYVALRASLDTTNVDWLIDAIMMFQTYMNDYTTALQYCERALRQSIEQNGDSSIKTATCFRNIGLINKSMGQYDKTLKYYQKALSIKMAFYGEQHEEIADMYINFGIVYEETGDYATAMDYTQKALAILQVVEHPDRNTVHLTYLLLGTLYRDTGDFVHAEDFLLKGMEHAEREYDEYTDERGMIYQGLGIVYKQQRKFDQALELYQKALQIYLRIFGERHEAVGGIYNNIGSCLMESGKNEEATPYLQKGLDIWLRIYGENHVITARTYINIGSNYGYAKQYEKALEYYWKAHDIFVTIIGADNPHMAGVYLGLGSMYNEIGNYIESKKYILKYVDIQRRVYGDNYPYRKEIEDGLEELEPKLQQQLQQQQQ